MSKTLRQKIDDIRNDFLNSLPGRIDKLRVLTQKIIITNWNSEAAEDLVQEVHNIRGFSSTHNLLPLNARAEQAETLINSFITNNQDLSTGQKQELQDAVNNLIEKLDITYKSSQQKISENNTYEQVDPESLKILVVDNDKNFCDTLCVQLQHLGYETKAIHDLSDLTKSIQEFKPKAIFIDITFNGQVDASTNMIRQLYEIEEICLPIIYTSELDDLDSRLAAVRNYSSAFLSKKFTLGDLKSILDLLVPVQKSSKSKVLIIDNDKVSSDYCCAILEHAGINVSSINSSDDVFSNILNFDPDIILLDTQMSKIDGFEMASIIRQHQNFSAIPLVIMSSETDTNQQFKMRSAGADDFILKPFKPHHLVGAIHNRIQRSKQTKRFMYTDALTGLMLFPMIKEQVTNLLDSCLRYNLDFSIASIDLDYFKQINDVYGNLVGDQILRNFSEFILSKTRKSDIVTRAGGEEFIIIFPYTNADNAFRALNSFREGFSSRTQFAGNEEFKVSFSAGIASTNNYHDLESLLAAADQALYSAKEKGRNYIDVAR